MLKKKPKIAKKFGVHKTKFGTTGKNPAGTIKPKAFKKKK